MRYPLYTTGDLACLPHYVRDARRRAVWIHVSSDDDRAWAQDVIMKARWRVLQGLPLFFVVGYDPSLSPGDVERLRQLVMPHQDIGDIEFLGGLFGYTDAEIHWFVRQLGIGKPLRKTK